MKGFGAKSIENKLNIKLSAQKLIDRSLALHAGGKVKEASIIYKKIIDAGIEDSRIYCALGLIALQNQKIEEAIKYNLKSISISPKYIQAFSNLGLLYFQIGKIDLAEHYVREAIKIDPKDNKSLLNLGEILYKKLELDEAELVIKKVINLNPNIIEGYYILSKILRSKEYYLEAENTIKEAIKIFPKGSKSYFLLHEIYEQSGLLDKARESLRESIRLDPNLAVAYYALSRFSLSKKDIYLYEKLLSIKVKNINLNKDKVNILFAKANLLHCKNNYIESSKCFVKANDLKLKMYKSSADQIIKKSNDYLFETSKLEITSNKDIVRGEECIFIVGMPRSGSTLIESILNVNKNVFDLGERPLIEMSLEKTLELNKVSNNYISFYKYYLNYRNKFIKNSSISTDKYLNNYLYIGYILSIFPAARIIHTYRNPLDNILSIYKAHFSEGIRYSSCLKSCARVYVNHMKIIKEYKKRFPLRIYPINYDLLVINPFDEIKKLISWMDWNWDDRYLSPENVNRNIKTASVIQARAPIHSRSINGWENYSNMLKPAIDQLEKYRLEEYQY